MYRKQLVRLMALGLPIALLVACAPTGMEANAEELTSNSAGITVVGRGEAYGQPDEAYVNVGVETFAEAVSDATTENEAIIQTILTALQDQGILKEDTQTSNYSLWAEQIYGERGPEGIAGYRVSNQVSVVIRDIDKVAQVLTAVTNAGANSIYGVSFSVADPAALEAEAREKAIADARERAQSLAQLSGVTLGTVYAVSEVIGQMPVTYVEGMGGGGRGAVADSAGISISPGQLSYQVQVQVTFTIQQN